MVEPGIRISSCSSEWGTSIVPSVSPLMKQQQEILQQSVNDTMLRMTLM
jgi:hypothetical protein